MFKSVLKTLIEQGFLPILNSRRTVLQALVWIGLCFCFARIGLSLAAINGNASPFWPAAGVGLAGVLLGGYHFAVGFWLGSFLSELTNQPLTLTNTVVGACLALGNCLGIVLAAIWIRRWVGLRSPLERVSDIFRFVLFAVVFSPAIDASVGSLTLSLSGKTPWAIFTTLWSTWWISTAIGVLVFAPLLLAWARGANSLRQLLEQRWLEAMALIFLVVVVSQISFGGGYPIVYMLIPLLVWAAFRFGQAGTTLLVVVMSVLSLVGTIRGFGPFIRESRLESLLLSQSFVGVLSLTCLVLLAVIHENQQGNARLKLANDQLQQAQVALQEVNEQLEVKVAERTAELAIANEEITALNQRLRAENLRMSAELEISRQLQQMILPKEHELAKVADLDIAGFMEPATEVGGDYYDILTQNGSVKIGIGDVTGHGLESSVIMLMVQMAVRTLLANGETNPKKFLTSINQAIYANVQRMDLKKNLTLSLLDYKDGYLQLSGQHENVILIRSNGEVRKIDTEELGFPIGLIDDISEMVKQIQIPIDSGDVIVLYTDGITEAENQYRRFYGLEKLCQVVQQHSHCSAKEIQRAVIQDVQRHIGRHKIYDDITLVVLKRK